MAKVNKYLWILNESIPKIDEHSLVKLEIVERYLQIYLEVLTQNHNMDSLKLSIVDGFAGGGLYQGGIKGTPLRIYETSAKTALSININRDCKNYKKINFDIDYHFVEKSKSAFYFLQHTLNSFQYTEANIQLYNGEFENYLNHIIKSIQQKSRVHRSIFILDQYGYSDASLLSINKIFKLLQKVELILTFSMDSLIDYISRKNPKVLENMGLSKEVCEKIFDIKDDNDFSRAKLQPILYQSIVQATGAKYYTPFFIKSDTSNRSYWLFHLSSHSKARDEMMKLHWEKQNTFQHYGKAGLKMLIGYNSSYEDSLFESFNFDHGAKEKSIQSLSIELPEYIHQYENIKFSELKNAIINETPATVDMIKSSIQEHIHYGDIIATSADGVIRQKSSTITDDDIISEPKRTQSRFIF